MEKTKEQEETAQFGIGAVIGSFSLKFWEEDWIRREMKECENLIRLLESREFQLEFNVGAKWFDDTIDLFKEKCKEHLIYCAERLVRSKNYR